MDFELFGPSITDHEIETVMDAMKNGWYGDKKYWYVEAFEAEFAAYHDRNYALMTPNCTSGIHLLLLGLGIGPGDEVIVPECTWIATAAPIMYVGATTVFADIDETTWCMSAQGLEASITPKTKAVICVDLYGNMADMDALRAVAENHGILFIEDSAGALGSVYKGKKAGKFGIGSVFSFHRTKTITTGEGGMLLLDDNDLFKRCHFLRDHGRSADKHYYNSEVAYKFMPSNLQASIGYAQFQRIEDLIQQKRAILASFKEYLSDVQDLYFNLEPPSGRNGVWCSILVIGRSHNINKEEMIAGLEQLGFEGRPFFYPLSSMPAYGALAEIHSKKHPVAYELSMRGICLPSAYNLNKAQILSYCDAIKTVLSNHNSGSK